MYTLFDDDDPAAKAYHMMEKRKECIPEEMHEHQDAFQDLEELFLKTEHLEAVEAQAKCVEAEKELAEHAVEQYPLLFK